MRDRTNDSTKTSTSPLRARALRALTVLVAIAAVLCAASPAQARVARSHVSYAPHLKRTIVQTRAVSHGSQLATWYGPGFYGHGLACGGTLKPTTFGIAHRTLPCGTLVTVAYHGRRVSVRVIDRGPFSGASVDLTSRTKQYLHFTSGSVRMTEVKKFRVLPRLHVRR
jgi:rare lipoprotein A (peptidoglycan hydrolase)